MIGRLLPLALLGLAACSSVPKQAPSTQSPAASPRSTVVAPSSAAVPGACARPYAPAQEDPATRGNYQAGGLYAAHVPDTTPSYVPNLDCIVEPAVVALARSPVGNRSPYTVLGRQYQVLDRVEGYVEEGIASYYGNKFHGRLTSNREVYDMYAFTAAHKSLPLPSFARVTNLDNGRSVVVRVNDRGPFHEGRVIDLSYAAAVKLDITRRGTGRVEVRALVPGEGTPLLATGAAGAAGVAAAPAAAAPLSTPLDQLVGSLPPTLASLGPPARGAGAPPAAQAAGAAGGSPGNRYQASVQENPSADEFDAWMKARGLRVATGRPGTPDRPSAGAATAGDPATAQPGAAMPAAGQPTGAAAAATAPAPRLQLQVGSFASRDNADRAKARLDAAGIQHANLTDVQTEGRTLWRLRVGAADAGSAEQLAARIASLGFDRPRVVRE